MNIRITTIILFFVILLGTLPLHTFAQSGDIDSLQERLRKHPAEDTTKVDLMASLAWAYQHNSADSIVIWANKGIVLAEKIGYDAGKADCLRQLGIANFLMANYNKALSIYDEALQIYKKIGHDKGVAAILNNIAIVQVNLGNTEKGMEFYKKSLVIREKIGDKKGIGDCYNNIGNTYLDFGNYAESLAYMLKGLKMREQIDDKVGIANSLMNIGNLYHSIGKYEEALQYYRKSITANEEIRNKGGLAVSYLNTGSAYFSMEDHDNAVAYFYKALKLNEEIGSMESICICLSNLARTYTIEKKYPRAEALYNRALQLFTEAENKQGMSECLTGLGTCNVEQGRYKKGIELLERSLVLTTETGFKSFILATANELALAYEKTGDYKRALAYQRICLAYKDSLMNEDVNKQIQQKQFDYELDKKQGQIELLEKDSAMQEVKNAHQKLISIVLLLVVILFALSMIILFISGRKEKRSKELIIEQHKEIQQQATELQELNTLKDRIFSVLSHDLRSPLASLTSMMTLLDQKIITPEEFMSVKKNLDRQLALLNLLLENLLNWSRSYIKEGATNREMVDIQQAIRQNMDLFADMAEQKHVQLSNLVTPRLMVYADKGQVDIIVRNLLSNAVKFSNAGGKISFSAEEKGDHIFITVSDNGVGMEPHVLDKLFQYHENISSYGTSGEKGTGLGLMLCKEFVQSNGGTLEVNSKPGEGTTIRFSLLKYQKPD